MNQKKADPRQAWLIGTLLSLSCGIVVALALWTFWPDPQGEEAPAPIATNPARRKADTLLAEADAKAKEALEARLKSLAALFGRGRAGAKEFATDALSWSGKWALLSEKIGLADAKSHEKFLSEKFSKHVFTAQELEAALKVAVEGYLLDLEAIESALLVRLRADLADIGGPDTLSGHLESDQIFRAEYERCRAEVALTLEGDLKMTVAREVGTFVAADVAGQIVLRVARAVAASLGVEAAILGAGASSSVATFGAGLVAAVILDYLLDAILRAGGYDPEGEIAEKVRSTIDSVERAAIEGKGGLHQELSRLHSGRSQLRRETILRLVEPKE